MTASSPSTVVVEADGGSRGNPGTAGYGALVRDAATGRLLAERAAPIGIASNNVAEYQGLIAGLEAVLTLDLAASDVEVRMDSKLVVEQMSGRWKIKHADMRRLAIQARDLARQIDVAGGRVRYSWIPREENAAADALSNVGMDGKIVSRDHRGGDQTAPMTDNPPEPSSGVASDLDGRSGLLADTARHSVISHTSIDCRDAYAQSTWWKTVLGYVDVADDPNEPGHEECMILDPDDAGPRLLFIEVPEPKRRKNRLHLDLRPAVGTREDEVARLVAHGAVVVADHRGIHGPGTGWVTLGDPEGNEFCVLRSEDEVSDSEPT